MCTINKSAHTKKSGNLFNDPLIYINVTQLCFGKYLLSVNKEFFLSLRCQHPSNLFQPTTLAVRRSSRWIASSPSVDLSKTALVKNDLIKQLTGNHVVVTELRPHQMQ